MKTTLTALLAVAALLLVHGALDKFDRLNDERIAYARWVADSCLPHDERRDLMPEDATPWAILDGIQPLERKIISMQPARAQALFLKRYVELTENRRAA